MYTVIEVEKLANTAIVTIDNPPMNVLSHQVAAELCEAFAELEQSDDVVCVILTGKGEKAFMAGADIKEFPQMMEGAQPEQSSKKGEVFRVINSFPKPTIAYLNGHTLGGGLELALACDIRISANEIQLGLPEVKLGLFPGGGGTQRLPRLIGEAKAKELMFTGNSITAEEALHLGIINKIADQGMEDVLKMAAKIGRHSLQSLRRIKEAVNVGQEKPIDEGLALEAKLFKEVFETEDVKEGIQAFIEKRHPVFSHR
ncbi:enoyl-CoA hydratase [Pradoshia eiseniae]|uniref:Enoyl-CoA hydratase n=1 Tax=Pradoshia eiseniae TaxID=2064768 RepID=A0A2S7N4Z6_9BACI|nr:enoyl-CoA hydratase-related protein [Pradoshia eiseniae]PQD97109.1 enoyl-CoA hydratase [Pradoshia eiseniae]